MGESWTKETVPRVMELVSTRLPQGDVCSLLLVSPWCYRALVSHPNLWKEINLHEMSKAGERLISALSLSRYKHIKKINLEFARDVEDEHLILLKGKGVDSFQDLESLNLNVCQKISDKGVEAITSCCPNLKAISIYWNVRVTDTSIEHMVKHCQKITDLNLSGCKNISDQSLYLIAESHQKLETLNITRLLFRLFSEASCCLPTTDLFYQRLSDNSPPSRCVKLSDDGLQQLLCKCSVLQSLNLYALSSFTDKAYEKIGLLSHLTFLDLCGAQNLTDQGVFCIARCNNLVSLNLTWCVRVSDEGVISIAQGCRSLEFLSLFGIVGVTDKSLEALSNSCSRTLTTLDVNGCVGIKIRSRDDLLRLFPHLRCFKVHS